MPKSRILWAVAAAAVLAVAGAGFANHFLRQPPPPSAALRGEALARKLGCFACHGPEGRGGVANPGVTGGAVPGWDGPTASSYVRDDQELREWILDGAPKRVKSAPPPAHPAAVPMPSYRGLVTDAQLADLVAYFQAVSGGTADVPDAAFEGRRLASTLGCFGCHGPSGIGGGPNPGSFKGTIPAWDGPDFKELVQNDAEMREWILEGKPRRLWDNPAARHFLEGQQIRMPAYRAYLTEEQTARLLAYIKWLRRNEK